jgi:hypothetical protein
MLDVQLHPVLWGRQCSTKLCWGHALFTVRGACVHCVSLEPDLIHTIQDALTHVSCPQPMQVSQSNLSKVSQQVLLEALESSLSRSWTLGQYWVHFYMCCRTCGASSIIN